MEFVLDRVLKNPVVNTPKEVRKLQKIEEERTPCVKTSDLYYSAWLLTSGGRIEAIEVKLDGSKKVSFQFSSPQIQRLTQEYLSGEAIVNLRQLKSSLKHLKDIIFQEMKTS